MIFFYLLVSGMPLVNQALFARFVSDLTMVKYFGAASLLYAFVHLLAGGGQPRLLRGRMALLLAAFYLLAAVSRFTLSVPVPWQLSPFLSFTSFVLLFFIVAAVVDTPRRLRWTLLVAIGSVAIGGVYMVREWLEFHNVYKDFRPGFVVGDSNYFTLSALLLLPAMYFLLQTRRPLMERLFLAGALAVTVAGVALGASRGGLLGMMAEFVYILWRSRRRALNFALLGALILPVVMLAPISAMNRLLHPDYSDVAAQDNRLVVWRAGFHMIAAHPVTGIGLGNFKPNVLQYEDAGPHVQSLAHNTYIEVAAELGLPGVALFLAMLATGFQLAGKAWRRTHREDTARLDSAFLPAAALGLQAAFLGAATSIFFLSAENQKLLWLMLALAPCLAALAEAQPAPALSSGGSADLAAPAPAPDRAAESLVAHARAVAEMMR